MLAVFVVDGQCTVVDAEWMCFLVVLSVVADNEGTLMDDNLEQIALGWDRDRRRNAVVVCVVTVHRERELAGAVHLAVCDDYSYAPHCCSVFAVKGVFASDWVWLWVWTEDFL